MGRENNAVHTHNTKKHDLKISTERSHMKERHVFLPTAVIPIMLVAVFSFAIGGVNHPIGYYRFTVIFRDKIPEAVRSVTRYMPLPSEAGRTAVWKPVRT